MVQNRIKLKKFNIILYVFMAFVFIHNVIIFNLPMLLMGDGLALQGSSTFSIEFKFPTFGELENVKNIARLTVLAVFSIIAVKLLMSFNKMNKISVLNNMKSDSNFIASEGKAIDLLDAHNPFLYSCKVQALRN